MDKSEELAERYLTSLDLGEVVYEPDGNVPPDFAIAGTIAVEVRRLNQNHELEIGRTQGLEEVDIPLRRKMQKYLWSFAPSREGESWYVGYNFKRPLEPWKVLQPLLDRALREFHSSPGGNAQRFGSRGSSASTSFQQALISAPSSFTAQTSTTTVVVG